MAFRLSPEPQDFSNFDNDLLDRKGFAQGLTNLVSNLEGEAVIILDGPWGAGKSTFVKMWLGELEKEGFPTILFDAFASDYLGDPFLALAGEVLECAKETSSSPIANTFKEQALSVGKIIGRFAVGAAIKAATLGSIDGEAFGELGEEVVKALADKSASAAEEIIKARLENHASDRKIFSDFRSTLGELAQSLSDINNKKPLIFAIDELDRCKPPFALSLLETMKHFFNVDDVIFVLVTNMDQLTNSVQLAYGQDKTGAQTYLEKFYHLRLTLPKNTNIQNEPDINYYLKHLLKNTIKTHNKISRTIDICSDIARYNNYSLRKIEKLSVILSMIYTTNENIRIHPAILAGLCILRLDSFILFEKAKEGTLTWAEANEALRISNWDDTHGPHMDSKINKYDADYWKFCLNPSLLDQNTVDNLNGNLQQKGFNNTRTLLKHAAELIDRINFTNNN